MAVHIYDTGTFPRRKSKHGGGLRSAASLWSVASLDSGLSKHWPDNTPSEPETFGLDKADLLYPKADFWTRALKRSKSVHLPSLERDTLRRAKSLAWSDLEGRSFSKRTLCKSSMDKRILATCLAGQGRRRCMSVPNLNESEVSHRSVLFALEMLYNMYALGWV